MVVDALRLAIGQLTETSTIRHPRPGFNCVQRGQPNIDSPSPLASGYNPPHETPLLHPRSTMADTCGRGGYWVVVRPSAGCCCCPPRQRGRGAARISDASLRPDTSAVVQGPPREPQRTCVQAVLRKAGL